MEEKINVYKVAKKLIGSIEPYGSHSIDDERYKNLFEHMAVTDKLFLEVMNIVDNHETKQEHSIEEMVRIASHSLERWYEILSDHFEGKQLGR